jgi:hypothetical protein
LGVATNLVPPIAWQPVATNLSTASGQWQFSVTTAPGARSGYFRLSVP